MNLPEILQLSEQLIRIQSTSDRTEELYRCIDVVEQFFAQESSLVVQRFEFNQKPSVVISTHSGLVFDVLMMGHLDVVPAPSELFVPRYEGTKLFGRGACDMKTECAVMMHLLKEYTQLKKDRSVALLLTTDEEIGGGNGAQKLIQEIGYRAKVALVPDGGGALDELVLRNKGVVQFRLHQHGMTAHGSRPWLGKNAVEELMRTASHVIESFPSEDDQAHWYPTCTIGQFSGGVAVNQVPDYATCTFDIRFPETSTIEHVKQRIETTVSDGEIEWLASADPIGVNADDESVVTYARCVSDQTGLNLNFTQSQGTNDGRFLSALGIPILVSRPLSGDQHSPTEWLETTDLERFYSIYQQFLLS